MPKEKVTLTLDAGRLAELRDRVGSRSVSATVDAALESHLAHLRHLAAVDEWLVEMDEAYGAVPAETLEWAARAAGAWDAGRARAVRDAG